jgi:hypothetical protein
VTVVATTFIAKHLFYGNAAGCLLIGLIAGEPPPHGAAVAPWFVHVMQGVTAGSAPSSC